MNAPERITVHLDRDGNEEWTASLEEPMIDVGHWDVEYVRADLYATLEQERNGARSDALAALLAKEGWYNTVVELRAAGKKLEHEVDVLRRKLAQYQDGGE